MLQNNVLGDAKGKKGSAAGRFWVKSALRCGRWRLVPREPDMLQIAQRAHSAARDTVEHAETHSEQQMHKHWKRSGLSFGRNTQ